jgi:hypothetical protein
MGEMMGVGAIAGHLLMSTAMSGAVAGASEMTSATVEADGKRIADKIPGDLGNFFVNQAWIPPDAVKKSFSNSSRFSGSVVQESGQKPTRPNLKLEP